MGDELISEEGETGGDYEAEEGGGGEDWGSEMSGVDIIVIERKTELVDSINWELQWEQGMGRGEELTMFKTYESPKGTPDAIGTIQWYFSFPVHASLNLIVSLNPNKEKTR